MENSTKLAVAAIASVVVLGAAGYVGYKKITSKASKKESMPDAPVMSEVQPGEVIAEVALTEEEKDALIAALEADPAVKKMPVEAPTVTEIIEDLQDINVATTLHPEVCPTGSQYPYWTSALRNLKNKEIYDVKVEHFVKGTDIFLPRGFWHCTVAGMSGIIHVTRNNHAAVVCKEVDGDLKFFGIATSADKFGGIQLGEVAPDRVKTFLSGN